MYTIIITPETGITFDNLPTNIIATISEINYEASGNLILHTDNNLTKTLLVNEFGARISFTYFDGGCLCELLRREPVTGGGGGGGGAGLIYGQDGGAGLIYGHLVEGVGCARGADTITIQEEVEEENDNGEEIFYGMRNVEERDIPEECHPNQVQIEIAKSLRNNISSNAGMVSSKLIELDKIMARSIIIQNEIELLMKPISENEKIIDIKNQIDTLNSSGGDIKKAYISPNIGRLIVLTNRLRSEAISHDNEVSVFDIGEMKITISLMILLCETNPGSTSGRPITIQNLTHEYVCDDVAWQCGHVKENEICFGNMFNQIHQALVEKKLLLAVDLIIRFIKNPDPYDAWGCKILCFPKIGGHN